MSAKRRGKQIGHKRRWNVARALGLHEPRRFAYKSDAQLRKELREIEARLRILIASKQ